MKNFPHGADALSPPIEIFLLQHVPPVVWNSPVLAPFFRKRIGLKYLLRRRTTRPGEIENIASREHIGTVVAHPDGHVAHEQDVVFIARFLHVGPLLEGDPLHIRMEKSVGFHLPAHFHRLFLQPCASTFSSLLRFRPQVPLLAPVGLHEHAKQSVIFKPGFVIETEFCKAFRTSSAFANLGLECLKRAPKQLPLEFFDLGIVHVATAHGFEIIFFQKHGKSVLIQILERFRVGRERGRVQRGRADCVVRAVVRAGFIDGQYLHELEAGAGRPFDEIDQRCGISDAQIAFTSKSKDGCKNASDFFFRR